MLPIQKEDKKGVKYHTNKGNKRGGRKENTTQRNRKTRGKKENATQTKIIGKEDKHGRLSVALGQLHKKENNELKLKEEKNLKNNG